MRRTWQGIHKNLDGLQISHKPSPESPAQNSLMSELITKSELLHLGGSRDSPCGGKNRVNGTNFRMILAHAARVCDIYRTMKEQSSKQPPTMTGVLRKAILDSQIPLLVLSKATQVQRASISRFLNESQSLRLDCADKLAAYFGLVLVRDEAAGGVSETQT